MSPFQKAVLAAVRQVPAGRVASYGQIAAAIGAPRAARQVGGAMRSMEGELDFPWWRIINNAGLITIKGAQFATPNTQRDLLRADGIPVSEAYEVNINAYRAVLEPSTQGEVEWQGVYD